MSHLGSFANSRLVFVIAIVALAIGFGVVVPSLAGPGIEPDVDLQVEQGFERLLKEAVEALEPNQRLETARKYMDAGNGAYNVYAILDTANPERLKTERYQILIEPAGGRKWQVAGKQLEDSTERLFRESLEPKQFFRFDSFRFEREGLEVTGSSGTAMAYHLQGKVSRILFTTDGLKYDYRPPRSTANRREIYAAMKNNKWKDDLVFTAEVVEISCDPVSCTEALSLFTGLEETSKDAMNGTLVQVHGDQVKDSLAERAEDLVTGFRLPYREDERSMEIAIKKQGKDHWVALQLDSRAGHEVRFRSDDLGTIFGYPARETEREVAAVDIERRDAELYQLTGLSGEVEIGLVEGERLEADLTITIEAIRDMDAIPFTLEAVRIGELAGARARFDVNELEDGQGNTLSWVRLSDSSGVVLLPETVTAGSQIVIHMEFQTRGGVISFNPSYSYLERSGWLPFVRYTDLIEEFELTIKVPSRYKVLGPGTNVSTKKEGRANVTHWVAKNPVHFPTIIFGDYEEDTPKTKATNIDGSEIPVTVHVDKNSMTDWGIRPGQLRAPGEIAVNALNIYRVIFGTDYPFGKLDLVNDPLEVLGAQAPASIVYLGSAIFRSQATLSTAFVGDMTTLVEERIAHEVAHQWWGSGISCANRRNYWFVESLAEYSSALFMEVVASDGYRMPEKGRKAYLSMVNRWHKEIMNSTLLCSVQDASTVWSNGGTRAAIYARGPYAFHILRETFGDEKFFSFLQRLSRDLNGREIVSRDIQAVAERAFGGVDPDGTPYTVDLEWFFDQWIRGVGIPEYTLDVTHRPAEGGGYAVEGTVRQRVFVGRFDVELPGVYYRGVVPLTVRGKDNQEYTARLIVQGPETPFNLKVPSQPLEVTLNKYGQILARPVRDSE